MFKIVRQYPTVVILAFLLGGLTDYVLVSTVRPLLFTSDNERRFIVKETSDAQYDLVMDMVTGCQYLSNTKGGIIPLQTLGECKEPLPVKTGIKGP